MKSFAFLQGFFDLEPFTPAPTRLLLAREFYFKKATFLEE